MHELSQDEMASAVDDLVGELLRRAGLSAPPVDALALARQHLGMTVCTDSRQLQRGRAGRAGRGRLIYLRPEDRPERRQWTVAHEVGEHFRYELLARLGTAAADLNRLSGEALANLFACRLLVPACWLAGDAARLHFDLPALKERYATASHEVLAGRLLDLPEPCVITIVDNNHVTRRRSNAWRVSRQLTRPEAECQEYVNYYSRARRVEAEGWTVHGWPVHQPDWKREILRSVCWEE